MCAGVVSESLVQLLAIEGIILKPPILQRAIATYCFQTISGDVPLNSPSLQRRIEEEIVERNDIYSLGITLL